MIKIEQLLPLLKKGFVAMDKDGCWFWHYTRPARDLQIEEWGSNESIVVCLSDSFDIEPTKDWTKSLMRCGDE